MEKLNVSICQYISKNWIKSNSNRAFAIAHDIDEKTVRRIKEINKADYTISLDTLKKICAAEGIKLSDFFKLIGD